MNSALFAVPAYACGAFLLSALMVRFLPNTHTSRQVRKNLSLSLALPILLFIDFVSTIDALSKAGNRFMRSTFELLSGRRLYSADERAYSYFGYSRSRRHSRRKSDRRARSVSEGKAQIASN